MLSTREFSTNIKISCFNVVYLQFMVIDDFSAENFPLLRSVSFDLSQVDEIKPLDMVDQRKKINVFFDHKRSQTVRQ